MMFVVLAKSARMIRWVTWTLVMVASQKMLHADSLFDIQFSYPNPAAFTPEQFSLLEEAFASAETLWENTILGYQGVDQPVVFPIEIRSQASGLASANGTGFFQPTGTYILPTAGDVYVNPAQILPMATGFDLMPGVNFLDEVMAHEVGHALGIGTYWQINDVYVHGSGRYIGEFALAAYREEYDPDATYVPVELAGGAGSANAHWNQLFRSSSEEGNPVDPLSLSPLTGIVDHRGRDLAQDLMSPAIDPDFGEPHLSNMTVQSLRDLGYRVVDSFPVPGDMDENGAVNAADIDFLSQQIRDVSADAYFDLDSNGSLDSADRSVWVEQIANTFFGDANLDGQFDSSDLTLVFQAAEYENNVALDSTWAEGDWNGDAEFDSQDLILAFTANAYEQGPRSIRPVPEPTSCWWLALFVGIGRRTTAVRRTIRRIPAPTRQ
ncbi:MAG: hypothetical protein R3C28_30360 [Pirellulaceae bacterium]